jgi:hypothetical protein
MYFHSIYLGSEIASQVKDERCKVWGLCWLVHWPPPSSPKLREPFIQPFSDCMAVMYIACGSRLVTHSVGLKFLVLYFCKKKEGGGGKVVPVLN